MEQEPELSELKTRVEAVGERFSEFAEDSRRRGQRLADLLDEVESSFVRDRVELDRLKQALVKSHDENAQLLDLLQRLLAVAEHAGGLGGRAALYDLEARVDRLYDQAVSLNGSAAPPRKEPEEAGRNPGPAGNGTLRTADLDELHDEGDEDPRWEAVPDEDEDGDEDDPLDLSRTVAEGGDHEDLGRRTSRVGLAESGAVQDIFKRVSIITGRLRET